MAGPAGMLEGMIDRARLRSIMEREERAFVRSHARSIALWTRAKASMPNGVPMSWLRFFYETPPVFVAEGKGSRFRDVDGNEYADFNIADISMFCGYGPEPVVDAVSRRIARGSQFLLANEDGIWVAEELARRYGVPKWQFTLSATQANTEAIRVARVLTGRDRVVFFDGKYHGHFDEALVDLRDGRLVPEEPGVAPDATARSRVVQFNDPAGLRAALEPRDVAIVMTEPALTNNVGLLLPEPGFHAFLRAVTRDTGALLAYDETHTQVVGPGGLTQMWDLEPDVVTIGKSIAGGVPLGAYGMSDAVASALERPDGAWDEHPPVATGGTLFGNALSMAAARAAMSEVLTEAAYAHTARLGGRLADGIEAVIAKAGLGWVAHRFWPRSGTTFAHTMPRNALEAYAARDLTLTLTALVYFANRGVWEAIAGAGPTCSVACSDEDVDLYLDVYGAFIGEITA
jgi:glutamate-1-semialdehyde 2,1-aminomutase